MSSTPPPAGHQPAAERTVTVGADGHEISHEGYAKSLGHRQVTMIAIGGAIGVGLFMGAGGRLVTVGPALILSYIIGGILAFFLMRAIGELIMYRRSSGSFVSYAGELFGAKGAFIAGWSYFINWGLTGIAELIAIGLYIQNLLPNLSWFISALIALVLLVAANLISVRVFGELEFWASIIKVTAIVAFLVIGTLLVLFSAKIGIYEAGFHNFTAVNDSFFPHGVAPMIFVLSGVVFAYNGIEIIGITAGEMKDARTEVPKAIRTVVVRIVVFYVGSVLLLALLLPSDAYENGVSPFVTVFEKLGIGWMGTAMTIVVATAAFSSTNSGLYSIGRIFRTMAENGHAPQWLTRMNARHVPYASLLAVSTFYLVGLIVAFLATGGHGKGSLAFDLAMETAAVGVLSSWVIIFGCVIVLRRTKGKDASELPMPGGTVAAWLCILATIGIVVLIGFSTATNAAGETVPFGLWILSSIPVFAILMVIGWIFVKRTHPELQEREHYLRAARVEDAAVRAAADSAAQ
ncbi:amino acid permease [Brachybacterium sp. JHP9]|uniref:Amino acid permease n=1 Tax=Brachybacterium equifaecis TaxID=2910770 RepID=A0ABT0QWI0_9MICO|nr:amino acid permease [Brachybacterium equifaecis]MCL6422032.1 amino acid permease [Brachybacterium equifaecis]